MLLCVLAGSAVSATALEKQDYDMRSTGHLYQLCATAPIDGDFATASYACRGFIAGAVQYHDGISDGKNLKRLICYPEGTTLADGQAAFAAWAEKHKNDTALMNEVAVKGLVKALAEKYPCSN